MVRRLSLLLGAFALVGGALTPASAVGDPTYHQPPVGACYWLSTKQVNKPSTGKPPVPCSEQHTVMTIAVVQLRDPVDWDDVYSRFVGRCYDAFYDAIGTTRHAGMSAYDIWWFIPTEEERAQGARWARCASGVTAAASPSAGSRSRCVSGSRPSPPT